MKKIASLMSGILLLFLVAVPTFAGSWQIANGVKTVSRAEIINGDMIFNGQSLKMNGRIRGDLVILAGNVTINGYVEGSVIGFTFGKLMINGTIGHDLRVFAREMVLKGRVEQSVTTGAISFITTPSSRIDNGLYGVFAELALAGHINGPVDITGFNSTVVGGQINGDFKGSLALITWKPPLEIFGKVSDYSLIPKNPSGIKGIKIKDYQANQMGFINQHQGFFKWMFLGLFVWFLGTLLLSLIFYRIFPRTAWCMTEPSLANFRRSIIIGAISFFGIPFLIQILCYIVVGIPIAIFIFLFYLLLLTGFSVPVYLWLGRLIFKSRLHPGLMIFLGALLMGLVTPVILVFQIVFVILGMGMIVGNIKPQFKERINSFKSR